MWSNLFMRKKHLAQMDLMDNSSKHAGQQSRRIFMSSILIFMKET
jgi:hypothetical protein